MRVPPRSKLLAHAHSVFKVLPFPQAFIVGGVARNLAASSLGIRRLPWGSKKYDVDVVVVTAEASEWVQFTEHLATETKLGGVRLLVDDLSVDIWRMADDVNAPSTEVFEHIKAIPFTCDQFALTRTGSLISGPDALIHLHTQHLALVHPDPQNSDWAKTRIVRAVQAGWTLCPKALAWYRRATSQAHYEALLFKLGPLAPKERQYAD